MKLHSRFLYGIISIALAAVIAFVAIPTVISRTNGKTMLVRVTAPIEKGTVISKQSVELAEVGGYNLPDNVARTLDDVVGRYAKADLAEGDYILGSKISDTPITSDMLLNQIPSGKVAISITVKTLASGLSNKLQAGDIIRIYHFLDVAEEVAQLRFVKVLAVTDSKGINVDQPQTISPEEEKLQSATITVLATPEQARILTGLENDGVIHAALVCRNNDALAQELLEQQDAENSPVMPVPPNSSTPKHEGE